MLPWVLVCAHSRPRLIVGSRYASRPAILGRASRLDAGQLWRRASMTRPSGRLPRAATLFAGVVFVAAACTPAASTAPSSAAGTPGAATSATPAAAIKYPETGEVTCPSG